MLYVFHALAMTAFLSGAPALTMAQGTLDPEKVDAALITRADTEPVLRVIVDTKPTEDSVSGGELGTAANAVAAQTMVANSLPPAHAHSVEPIGEAQLVMEVTREGLAALSASPLVTKIAPDGLSAPQSGGGDLSAPQ